eukprot:10732626-Heterocapsa_arctica.AAC.1
MECVADFVGFFTDADVTQGVATDILQKVEGVELDRIQYITSPTAWEMATAYLTKTLTRRSKNKAAKDWDSQLDPAVQKQQEEDFRELIENAASSSEASCSASSSRTPARRPVARPLLAARIAHRGCAALRATLRLPRSSRHRPALVRATSAAAHNHLLGQGQVGGTSSNDLRPL